jgi:ubiquinone/menaquinone biosynthesis C-methylase UbiE
MLSSRLLGGYSWRAGVGMERSGVFERSAAYYDALYAFKDYAGAVAKLRDTVRRYCPCARRLLDVACGTGRHLEHLRSSYEVEGLDLNPQMLEVARHRCPGIPFHRGDMAEFELPRRYDVVTCLFSSIGYVQTLERLRLAIRCMARHLEPGGVLIIEPWFTPQSYVVGRLTANFVDEPDLKIAWMYISEIEGTRSILEIHFQVGTASGIEHFVERHEIGLFSDAEYTEAFVAAGLRVTSDAEGLFGRGMYIGAAEPPGWGGIADAQRCRHPASE